MKKILLLISIISFAIPALCQIETTTKGKCYLFQKYEQNGLKKRKKIGKEKPIILLREFNDIQGYYVVSYEKEQYLTSGENINEEGLLEFKKLKADLIRRKTEIEDSVRREVQAKHAIELQRRTDSIAEVNRIKDSIRQVEYIEQEKKIDSLKQVKRIQAFAIIESYSKEKKALVQAGMPIEIAYLYASDPNSAGGSDLVFKLKNISPKTIKYISVTGYPINAVNDKCRCSIRGYSQTTRKGVGPIEEGELAEYNWENVWYNHTIDKYVPTSINIQYMNGTSLNIVGEKLKKIMKARLLDEVYNDILKEYNIDLDEIINENNSEK